MAKASKYYVVWVGVRPGIYHTWEDCQMQIKGFPQARYKSYPTLAEAERAFSEEPKTTSSRSVQKKTETAPKGVIWNSISVDAACSGNPGVMEYRAVQTKSKQEIFRQGPFIEGTNNIGEFLALVHALALLKKKGHTQLPIYTDSRTAMAWIRNKKIKTSLKKNSRNENLFDLIDRAIDWLETNNYENPILKWETEKWGEIPADFGRK
jgi:ribonuclease HI